MSNNRFASGDAISFGWELFKKHVGFMIGLIVVVLLVSGIAYLPQMWAANEGRMGLYLVFYILAMLISYVMTIGMIRIVLKLHDGESVDFSELFTNWNLLGKYIAVNILVSLIVGVGFLLLIVPGVIWLLKYSLAQYYIIDKKDMGIMEAIKASGEATNSVKLDLFGFFILLGAMNFVGALVLGLGLLVTIPVSAFAMAYVYRHLSGAAPAAPATPAAPAVEPPAAA